MDSLYVRLEDEALREQVQSFVAREVEPHALAWEQAGLTPRAVLRRMGEAGMLGCQQVHGGIGYMRGTPIERLWRDARGLAIGGGATEVMLDEAAKRY